MLWQFVPNGSPTCCSICLDPWASWIIFKTIERCWRPVVIKFGGETRNCPDQCFGSERFKQTTSSGCSWWWRFSYQKKDRWPLEAVPTRSLQSCRLCFWAGLFDLRPHCRKFFTGVCTTLLVAALLRVSKTRLKAESCLYHCQFGPEGSYSLSFLGLVEQLVVVIGYYTEYTRTRLIIPYHTIPWWWLPCWW